MRIPTPLAVILLGLLCLFVSSCSERPTADRTTVATGGQVDSSPSASASESEVDAPGQDVVSLSVSGDGSPDLTTVWIEQGESILVSEIRKVFEEDTFTPEYDFDREIARLDEDRFPDWARGRYAVCVYWELPMTDALIRMQREPGESRWFEITGKCWGWILVGGGEEGGYRYHILELAHEWPPALDETESFSGARGVFQDVDDWGPN